MDRKFDLLLVGAFESDDSSRLRFLAPQLGIERLAAYIRQKGFKVKTIDPNIDGEMYFKECIMKYRPAVVGFSVSYVTLLNDLSMIHFVKEKLPDSLIAAGGQQATFDYENLLNIAPIDLVVLGEGEFPLLHIVEAHINGEDVYSIEGTVHAKDGNIIRNGNNQPLNREQFREMTLGLDFSDIDYRKYWQAIEKFYDVPNYFEINTIRLFTLNYCPFHCVYCSSRTFLNAAKGALDEQREPCGKVAKLVGLDAHDMLKLVRNALDAYPETKRFMIQDDEHLLVRGRVEKFCEMIVEEKQHGRVPTDLQFMCQARVNDVTPNVLEKMSEAGYSLIGFGVETFSERMLKSIRKKNNAVDVHNALSWTLDAGIKPFVNLMLFLPEITMEDLWLTIDSALDYIEQDVEVAIEPFVMPLPGSSLYYSKDFKIHTEELAIPKTDTVIDRYHFVIPRQKEMADLAFKVFYSQEGHLDTINKRYGFKHLPTRLRSLITFHNIACLSENLQRIRRIEKILNKMTNQ